jgi:GNAT superfamily N-acetyltransferase
MMDRDMVELVRRDPGHPHARQCLRAYFSELDRRFDTGFDPGLSLPADEENFRPPAGVFLLASLRATPIGCGALRFHGREPAEIKRMWVAASARGLGVGRRLLGQLDVRLQTTCSGQWALTADSDGRCL